MLPEILTALALIPDRYKERTFRYIGKLLPSSLSKPRYQEMLKAQAERRLSSINETKLLNVCKTCQRTVEILGQKTSAHVKSKCFFLSFCYSIAYGFSNTFFN